MSIKYNAISAKDKKTLKELQQREKEAGENYEKAKQSYEQLVEHSNKSIERIEQCKQEIEALEEKINSIDNPLGFEEYTQGEEKLSQLQKEIKYLQYSTPKTEARQEKFYERMRQAQVEHDGAQNAVSQFLFKTQEPTFKELMKQAAKLYALKTHKSNMHLFKNLYHPPMNLLGFGNTCADYFDEVGDELKEGSEYLKDEQIEQIKKEILKS